MAQTNDIDLLIQCFKSIAAPDELVEQNDGFAIHALKFRQAQAEVGLKIAENLKLEMKLGVIFGPRDEDFKIEEVQDFRMEEFRSDGL